MIHSLAIVEAGAEIGERVNVWRWTHVRDGAKVGSDVSIGQSCFIDAGAVIGNGCRIQNHVSIYNGVTLEDGVFVGPHVVFTNDPYPRIRKEWEVIPTLVKAGASIGAGAVILPGITLGEYCMVGAGAIVTKDVPAGATVKGGQAR